MLLRLLLRQQYSGSNGPVAFAVAHITIVEARIELLLQLRLLRQQLRTAALEMLARLFLLPGRGLRQSGF